MKRYIEEVFLDTRLGWAVETTAGCLKCVSVVVDRKELSSDKGVGPVLSGGTIEGEVLGELYDESEELEYPSLVVTLLLEDVSDGDLSGSILDVNEELGG